MFITFTRAVNMQRVCIAIDLVSRVEEERGMLGSVRFGCRIYARRGRANWKAVESYTEILGQIKGAGGPAADRPMLQTMPAGPAASLLRVGPGHTD